MIRRRHLVSAFTASALLLVGGACNDDDPDTPAGNGDTSTTTGATPATTAAGPDTTAPDTTAAAPAPAITAGPQPLGSVAVTLTEIAGLTQPVALAVRAGDAALYVVEKVGRVTAVRDGAVDPTPVLDLTGSVSTGSEQGLLGLAFSPDGGKLYVNFTNPAGDTRVVEYAFSGGRADPSTAREVLAVDQPYANHNGGNLVFGPDGMLWIGLGDGGSGNDPENRAQDLGTLLGKMLRIDPTPSAGRAYTIPPDNPFVGQAGARGEIWSYGLRNPWRYSFDRATGDLWIGDVGPERGGGGRLRPRLVRGRRELGLARRWRGRGPTRAGGPTGPWPPSSTTTSPPGGAPSPAATCTGGRGSRAWPAPTSTATTAGARSWPCARRAGG